MLADIIGFRTRSSERDSTADNHRIGKVRAVLEETRADIARERDGLQARITDQSQQAAALLDELGDFQNRPSADETRVAALEGEIMRGQQRIERLNELLENLDRASEIISNIKI